MSGLFLQFVILYTNHIITQCRVSNNSVMAELISIIFALLDSSPRRVIGKLLTNRKCKY